MAYDARQVANWFIQRAKDDGKQISIMSLLKLAYIAHGWRLEMRNEPLFNNKIEAWQYGPVIPDVYRAYHRQGVQVAEPLPDFPAVDNGDDVAFLNEIWKIYGSLSAFQLSDITHVTGGAWELATKVGGAYAHIPDELIKQHYVGKRVRSVGV